MTEDEGLPPDPDLDAVPSDLRILAGLNHGKAVVISEDGVSRDTVVLVPSLWRHAEGVTEDE